MRTVVLNLVCDLVDLLAGEFSCSARYADTSDISAFCKILCEQFESASFKDIVELNELDGESCVRLV